MRTIVLAMVAVLPVGCAWTNNNYREPQHIGWPTPQPVAPRARVAPSCSFERRDTMTVTVHCRTWETDKEGMDTVARASLLEAAKATASAGKTHFVFMANRTDVARANRVVQAGRCETRPTFASAVANAFADRTTRCSTSGSIGPYGTVSSDTTCTQPRTPPPVQYETKCSQDVIDRSVTHVDFADTYEMITGEEAARRANPVVPALYRPIAAMEMLAPLAPPPAAPEDRAMEPAALDAIPALDTASR